MRQWLGWLLIAWILLVCTLALIAYGDPAGAPTLDQRAEAIASQLRCPVCQGESIAESQADIAVAIRGLIRTDLRAGESPDRITAFLLSRYPNISLSPSTTGAGSIAWLAPPLLLLGGVVLVGALVVDWLRTGRNFPGAPRAAYVARVRTELAAEEAARAD